MVVRRAATVADGNEEVGDSVVTAIDGDIRRGHAPTIPGLDIRSFSDAGLHGGEIVGLNSLEQVTVGTVFFARALRRDRMRGQQKDGWPRGQANHDDEQPAAK
jgi:hypothetical protein